MFQKRPNYHFLKVFGCSCFPYLRDYSKHKLDFHSSKCIFIGYSLSHKGYRCLHSTGKVFVSRHVLFNEMEFPYKEMFAAALSDNPSQGSFPGNISFNLFQRFQNAKAVETLPAGDYIAHDAE